MNLSLDLILEAVGAIGLTVFAFFARSYFAALAKDLARLEGNLAALQNDIRENTKELAGMTSELKAVWRFIDGAHERATDVNGGSNHGR